MRRTFSPRFAAALAIWLVPEVAGAVLEPRSAQLRRARRDAGSAYAIVAGCCCAAAGGILCAGAPRRRAVRGAGYAAIVAGTALRWTAIATLGASFTRFVTIAPAQTIVRRGPYRFVRHPAYTGVLLSFAGLACALESWRAALAIALPLGPAFAYRIAVEERALAAHFGPAFDDYAAHTYRLLPPLY